MSYADWLAPEIRWSTRRRHRTPVSQPRLPRDSTGVGALKHKAEIVRRNGWRNGWMGGRWDGIKGWFH
jgi:hypothetical protein